VTFVIVIRRNGFFASVNLRWHVGLVGWRRPMWRRT
jgi:hypothetical protein